MKWIIRFLTTATALLVLTCAAAAQQAPPPKTEPAKPKVKKVWTNEDVIDLRQPADVYEEEKHRQAEEAAKQKADAAKAASQSSADKQAAKPKDYLPKTVNEAEKLVAAKQYEIGQQYDAIDLVKKELAQATTDESRAAFQKRIDTLTATLEESIAAMHSVDARLQELKSAPPPPPQPAAGASGAPSPEVAELEKQIEDKQEKVGLHMQRMEEIRSAIATTDSDVTRASLQKKLDGFVKLLNDTNTELTALQQRLKELKAKPAAPKP